MARECLTYRPHPWKDCGVHKFLSRCFIRLMAFYSFFTILLALHNIPHTSKASSIDQPSLIIHLITPM